MNAFEMVYIIGAPGVGKTTLVTRLFAGVYNMVEQSPFAHTIFPGGVMLGLFRGTFGGTDVLGMDVQPKVIRWLMSCPYPAVIGEGDRLANDKFFDALRANEFQFTVIGLDAGLKTLEKRREQRGSQQNAQWLRGRETKAQRLMDKWCAPEWRLDAEQPVETLAQQVGQHPAIRLITGK